MISHLLCSKKSKKVFLLYEPNIKCHLLTISKGISGIYYSQIDTCLTEVCLRSTTPPHPTPRLKWSKKK